MGHGYAILVWDDWGVGLTRINPRLHTEGEDSEGNPCNWWPCEGRESDNDLVARHVLGAEHWQVLR